MGPTTRLRKTKEDSALGAKNTGEDSTYETPNCTRRVNVAFASNIIQETLKKNQSFRKGKVQNRKQSGVPIETFNNELNSPLIEELNPKRVDNINLKMSSQPGISPSKRGGRNWRGKKKSPFKSGNVTKLPMVVKGIPHLANSFVQKDMLSKDSEKENSETFINDKVVTKSEAENDMEVTNNPVNEINKSLLVEDQKMEVETNPEIKTDNSLIPPIEDKSETDVICEIKVEVDTTLPLNHNINSSVIVVNDDSNDKLTSVEERTGEDKAHAIIVDLEMDDKIEIKQSIQSNENIQSQIFKEKVKIGPEEPAHLVQSDFSEIQSQKEKERAVVDYSYSKELKNTVAKEAPKVEFISEYSSSADAKKKVPETIKVHNKIPEPKTEPVSVTIGPMQPVLQLVDPAQLEKETEQYYKEMGSLSSKPITKTPKPQCLTPGQIAKITKDYPQVNPNKDKNDASEKQKAAWALLHQYWTFVQENPYDFDGWIYLLTHVETIDNIEAARSAFEGFLPLYPYCFAYWMKLSDLELKHTDLEKSLGVLYLGTKCVPFCSELWVPLLTKFMEYATKENISEEVVRGLYEYALSSLGLAWNSSSLWELCINYELGKGDLVRVMNLYRRILTTPTKLYNKHWDYLLALIRDYHPRNLLTIEEYSHLKKGACDLLKIKFNPPSLEEPKTLLKVTQPEDKIHTAIKEKIVASLIPIHEVNEKECETRWKYEEKLKRPYFHVKPLERKQLKMWREYLDFEIKEGDPVRIVSLFERCLVPCAMYEEFWCKYTSYMEDHVLNVLKKKYALVDYKPGCFSQKEKSDDSDSVRIISENKKSDGKDDKKSDNKTVESSDSGETISDLWREGTRKLEVNPETKFEVTFLMNRLSEGIGVAGRVLTPPLLTPASILRELTWEDVRQIYRRGAWIHCPSKPLILMQWAEFEEAQENIQTARELLNTVIVKHPKLLKARIQLIELERRSNELDRVEELYAQTFSIFDETRIRSCIAIRYARFLFKIREEDDKALLILRKVLKKDKGNIHLYHHVFDVCYQRRPIDCNGVLASVMLALASKELSLEDKYWFCIKRSEFLREHGTMTQVKEAKSEMEEIKRRLDKEKLTGIKDDGEDLKRSENSEEEKRGKEVNNNNAGDNQTSKKDQMNDQRQANGKTNDQEIRRNGSPLILLQQPPQPPVLDPVSKREGKDRERRRRREEREGSTEGRRHKHKSSRSSRKEKKSSRRSKKHRRRDVEDEEEDGEVPEEGELEEVFDENGIPLYSSKNDANPIMNNTYSQYGSNLPPQQLQQQQQQQQMQLLQQQHQQQQQQQRVVGIENKPYQAVPPSWDLNAANMPNYGYGLASDTVKDGQNSLYERYYDMIKQGYEASQERNVVPQGPPPTGQGTKIILGNKNCYLPPPPMPQGILGESLFNQGKLENLHNLMGKQGNLPSANNPPVFPHTTSCLPPLFTTRPMQTQDVKPGTEQGQGPPLPFLSAPPMGIPPPSQLNPTTRINPNIMQSNIVSFNRSNLLEPPGKVARMDQSLHVERNNQPIPRNPSLLGPFPGSKPPLERENRGGRGEMRNSRSRDRSRQHHHHHHHQEDSSHPSSSQHQPVPPPPQPQFNTLPQNNPLVTIPVNIKEMLNENISNSFRNVPEWLIKEGGELRLSDTANGESIIRYWPRYLNEDGHSTLFQSLRKTVKWHQRRTLINPGPPTEDNWALVPKLMSWIGPCNYEKDGMALTANTHWPPEIVDLLHRLIRFSNSQFNSCLMSLYSNGFSHHPWHTEAHEAMAKNPTTACISLGVTRTLEMKRANGVEYLRFPLFPGSLFIMEGACHTDWLCQIPKETQIKEERINLSFRTMLMIKGVTV